MGPRKRRRTSNPSVRPLTVVESSESSSQSDGATSTPTRKEIPTSKRGFPLHCRIPGNDAINGTRCYPSDSLCDLCCLFLETSLGRQNPEQQDSRLVWRNCSDSIGWLVFRHYTTLRMLKSSANAGCELCLKVLGSQKFEDDDKVVFALSGKPWYHGHQDRYGKEETDWYTFSVSALRLLKGEMIHGGEIVFELVLAKDEADCLRTPYESRQSIRRSPSVSPYSEECFNRLKSWLEDCAQNHSRCYRHDSPLPMRLIDVSPVNTASGTESVVLVESALLPSSSGKVHYVALSYCWGGWNGLVTNTGNLPNMKRGVPVKDLPAAVSDAILVCRRFDVKYLWVDALCICQNDEKEWEAEAAKMANVYGGCDFAISALSSSKASENFLKERDHKPVALGTAKASYGSWQDDTILFLRRIPRTIHQEFALSSLNTRGWPLQERILAPAVIHYGRDQVIWECNTSHLISETGETERKSESVIRLSDVQGLDSNMGVRGLWGCILEEYTKRKLSHEKDRFIAISGIASKLREDGTYKGRYVAGLWENDLELQLAWKADDITKAPSFEPVQPNLAFPTWSWAYRNFPIDTMVFSHPTSALSVAARFKFKTKTEKRRSQRRNTVCFCAITLKGFVQKVTERAISQDSRPVRHSSGFTRYLGLPGRGSGWFFDQETLGPAPLYCLRLLETAPRDDFESYDEYKVEYQPSVIYYLVLQKAKTVAMAGLQDPYVRVGILELSGVSRENFVDPYPDVLCQNGQPLLTDGKSMEITLV